SGRKLQSCVTPNVGIGMAASTALMPRGPWQHGVSKVIQRGGAVRALWNVLRDAASALLRTRGLGVTKLRKGGLRRARQRNPAWRPALPVKRLSSSLRAPPPAARPSGNLKDLPMTIKIGDRLPNATVRLVTPDGPKPVETKDYFSGKKVVLFGLPGAFTPTCHKNHLPGFIVGEAAFKAKGVDKIAMTSVNDHFVLSAWSDATGAKGHIDFLADGSGDFAKALGLEFDASAGGLGVRSKRYAMLVEDGVVKQLNIEPKPGEADISSATHLLEQMK